MWLIFCPNYYFFWQIWCLKINFIFLIFFARPPYTQRSWVKSTAPIEIKFWHNIQTASTKIFIYLWRQFCASFLCHQTTMCDHEAWQDTTSNHHHHQPVAVQGSHYTSFWSKSLGLDSSRPVTTSHFVQTVYILHPRALFRFYHSASSNIVYYLHFILYL